MSDQRLYEILDGKSKLLTVDGGEFFYKHPTVFEMELESQFKEEFEITAVKLGLKTELELLTEAKKWGTWSDTKEEETRQLQYYLPKQEQALLKHTEPSICRGIQNSIDETKSKLEDLAIERANIVKYSSEEYILRKTNLKIFSFFLYTDKELKVKASSDELIQANEAFLARYSELSNQKDQIKRSYAPSFFELFTIYKDNPYHIFGKNIFKLTIFQKALLFYAMILRRKLDNVPNIPDGVMRCGWALYNFTEQQGEKAEGYDIRKTAERSGGLENMNPEDYIT